MIQTKEISQSLSCRHWKWDLCCPGCKSPLKHDSELLRCTNHGCGLTFPFVRGIPVVIDESKSVFRIQEIIDGESFFAKRPPWMQRLRAVFPKAIWQPQSATNCQRLGELLCERENPRVLIVGAGMIGQGLDRLMKTESIEFVETDVGINGTTALVCDGHDLPFP